MAQMTDNNITDWNKIVMAGAVDGAKDGAAVAAAEIITDAVIGALSGHVPYLSMVAATEFGRAVLLVATPWAVGALTHVFPDMIPGDHKMIRRVCYRAVRGSVAMRFSPMIARLRAPLTDAFKSIASMEAATQE